MLAENPVSSSGVQSVLSPETIPLVVDLDGTLLETDLLYESYFDSFLNGAKHHLQVARQLFSGKAILKRYLAEQSDLDYATLPYDEKVLAVIMEARQQGRRIYLATASDAEHAEAIAAHLGLFDGVFASDGQTNLDGERKARKLVEAFGDRGFDYLANGKADLPIWNHSAKALTVRLNPQIRRKLGNSHNAVEELKAPRGASFKILLRALRVHQHAKNGLIFLPLLAAHLFTVDAVLSAALAFAAFSLCASAVYIINDLLDIKADRGHPKKRQRPIASGALPIPLAMAVVPALLVASICFASFVSLPFLAVLAVYLALTTAYSLYLKRKMMIDVVALASLYTVRVFAGAVAVEVVVSEWLLAFSMFLFTALALIKRYSELSIRLDSKLSDPTNRNYKIGDLDIVAALGAAAGMNAITVFTLYVASPSVQAAYSRPMLLYLVCPLLLYWFCRALMMAHRRLMDDDPVVFALKDRNSALAGILVLLIVLIAI
jgi:4-hydroxybenzoate polyprenyltransferase